jgi:hypothetical protein
MGPLTWALQKYLGRPGRRHRSVTVKALQRKVGAAGRRLGTDTTRRLQTKLNAGTF